MKRSTEKPIILCVDRIAIFMKCVLILFISLSTELGYSQEMSNKLLKGELYTITEAYLFRNDTTYSLNEKYVDQPSRVLLMFGPDSSIVISIDHGKDKVIYLGYAKEIEDPGHYDFLKGQKNFYDWSYNIHESKVAQMCLVIKEHIIVKDMVRKEYYRFHLLFNEEQIMFFCDLPIIHELSAE